MATNIITPKALADEIGVDAKVLRSYLRKAHTRAPEVKNTTWLITTDVADLARANFAKQETTS